MTKPKKGMEWEVALLILGFNIIVMVIGVGLGWVFASRSPTTLWPAATVSLLCIMMWPVSYLFAGILAKRMLEDAPHDAEGRCEVRMRELEQTHGATLSMLEELTQAKKSLEKYSGRLEEVLKTKTEFTSTVSHELRTPLAAIKEGISIVLDGTGGPVNEDQKTFLGIAKRNVDRLTRLINDVLDFHKLESGKMAFEMDEMI